MRFLGLDMSVARKPRKLREDETGSLSVETLLMAPLLGFLMIGMFVYFQIFRQDSLLAKSSYTVTDVMSREIDPINQAYIDNMFRLLQSVSNVQTTISMRVGVVKYDLATDSMVLRWEAVPDGSTIAAFTPGDIDTLRPKIPDMDDQDTVIIVETNMPYTPPFLGGSMFVGRVSSLNYNNLIIMRSRFIAELCYETGDDSIDDENVCLAALDDDDDET